MPPAKLSVDEESRPNPDPTLLTTQQLATASMAIKELMMAFLAKLEEVMKTRLDGMDKAIELARHEAAKIAPMIDEKIDALRSVANEKFSSVANQFRERDERTAQAAANVSTAITAALQAAEKAVGKQQEAADKSIAKSETSFDKRIEQMSETIKIGFKGMDDKLNDQKDRTTRLESEKRGAVEKVVETQAAANTSSLGTIAAAVGGGLVAGGGVAAIVAALMRH